MPSQPLLVTMAFTTSATFLFELDFRPTRVPTNALSHSSPDSLTLIKLKQRLSTASTHPSRSAVIVIPSMNSSAGIVPNPAYPSTRPSSRATKFIKHAHWIDHGFVG